ncbi:zf-HC2 domain-containing protein [Micromonospora sp. WMMC250]|uniref:zf-HC2 domain-containing protein n=1 Tax=Micromonospora sp. WMMC250 TaxID=3014781 RepID=UPI0022B5E911|nr:zf-HC2 domain-containing protein [Micromonospora sp. WMMC250]MCZ7379802.1 zf-HC2 domain-containing protein [Micromonospora sp. WMMC250]
MPDTNRSVVQVDATGSAHQIDVQEPRNQLGPGGDHPFMRCDQWREILSAQLDGEATRAQEAAVRRHLDVCPNCRRFHGRAGEITRLARTRLVPAPPELTNGVLVSAPSRRGEDGPARGRVVAVLRVALGTLGAVQVVLGLAQIGRGAADGHLPGGQHLWHEFAAWNIAVGAGFVVGAVRRSAAVDLVPLLTVFVAMLGLLSVNDLLTSAAAAPRLASHAFLLAGYAITLLLAWGGWHGDGPLASRRQAGLRRQLRLYDRDDPAPPRLVTPPPQPSVRAVRPGAGWTRRPRAARRRGDTRTTAVNARTSEDTCET